MRIARDVKVFWSWQSDVTPKENRWFIRDALVDAIKLAAIELAVAEAERPEIDQDTQGAAGMVDIAATILGNPTRPSHLGLAAPCPSHSFR